MSALTRLLGELVTRVRDRGRAPDVPDGHREVEALFQDCVKLAGNGELDAASDCYRRLLELDPQHAKGRNNLGLLQQRRGDFQSAAQSFQQAVRSNSGLAEPHVNLGNLHDIRGDPDAAIACYRRAVAIRPDYAQAHCSLAQALLATGRYEEGWTEFEWRWRGGEPALRLPPLREPLWDGSQDIAGRRILLHAEQGYGDAIQFIRYASMVAARGAHVIAACDPALTRLFRSVPGVVAVAEPGSPLPEFDYHAPLMSLPRAFRTTVSTIPAAVPYLSPDAVALEAWREKLAAWPGLKVGLAWAGRPTFIAAALKACPLERLAPLLAVSGCRFFSLQKGEAAAELRQPGPWTNKIIDCTEELSDFHDTAALIGALDLVISIDTAVAHLAGALGKPVWIMLAAVPDWRWVPRAGCWYPTATLFSQRIEGDWAGVADDVQRALDQRAVAKRGT